MRGAESMETGFDRKAYLDRQAWLIDETFRLTDGEEAARSLFLQLCMDTVDALLAQGEVPIHPFYADPQSAFSFLQQYRLYRIVDVALVHRWSEWGKNYLGLLLRNPRLALCDLMHQISETHDASSWPTGYELRIRDWVDSGRMHPMPFDDRYNVINERLFQRLQELRRLCDGWPIHDENGRVTFMADI